MSCAHTISTSLAVSLSLSWVHSRYFNLIVAHAHNNYHGIFSFPYHCQCAVYGAHMVDATAQIGWLLSAIAIVTIERMWAEQPACTCVCLSVRVCKCIYALHLNWMDKIVNDDHSTGMRLRNFSGFPFCESLNNLLCVEKNKILLNARWQRVDCNH